MAITFYYSPMSSASRVHWALEELGVPYQAVKVDLRAGDQKKPEFLKINPMGKVPALVDGDVAMFESLALFVHLGETYGVEKGLWPKAGTKERGVANSWTAWSSVELTAQIHNWMVLSPESQARFAAPAEHRSKWVGDAAKASLEQMTRLVDAHLDGRQWMLGETFSLCDVAVVAGFAFMRMVMGDASPVEAHKNVAAWVSRAQTRPALGRAMQG